MEDRREAYVPPFRMVAPTSPGREAESATTDPGPITAVAGSSTGRPSRKMVCTRSSRSARGISREMRRKSVSLVPAVTGTRTPRWKRAESAHPTEPEHLTCRSCIRPLPRATTLSRYHLKTLSSSSSGTSKTTS